MMQNLFQNYVFQSNVGPKFGLKPINEDLLTRLDTSTSSHTISCISKLCDVDISYGTVNINGYVRLYTPGGTNILTLRPWNYSAANFYSDANVENQINLGKRMRKCGVWTSNIPGATYIKWRFLASEIEIIQYEFDCTIYETGVIEWGFSSLDSLTTTKNYGSYTESGRARSYCSGYNDGSSVPITVIEVCDGAIAIQNSEFGGLRKEIGIWSPIDVDYKSWPGKNDFGALYRFVPRPETSKKILPRQQLRTDDTNSRFFENGLDRKSTRLNSSHVSESRMPSSA